MDQFSNQEILCSHPHVPNVSTLQSIYSTVTHLLTFAPFLTPTCWLKMYLSPNLFKVRETILRKVSYADKAVKSITDKPRHILCNLEWLKLVSSDLLGIFVK